MEGFTKQGLRRYAHSRGDVCDCGTDVPASVDAAALRIVEGTATRWLAAAAAWAGSGDRGGFRSRRGD